MNWLTEFVAWDTHCRETLGDNYNLQFAIDQWMLFWSGVRDVRLHDNCIWLIDKYGYTAIHRAFTR